MTPRMKTCLFLYAVLAVSGASQGVVDLGVREAGVQMTMTRQIDMCNVEQDARIQCGEDNTIAKETCESMNCCWDEEAIVFPCFKTAVVPNVGAPITMSRQFDVCHVEKDARIQCGNVGIRQTECESINCCWKEAEPFETTIECFETAVETTYFEHDVYVTPHNTNDRLCSPDERTNSQPAKILADFNRDKAADLMCRKRFSLGIIASLNTSIEYYKAEEGFNYEDDDHFTENDDEFCDLHGDRLRIADVDNDGMADLVCILKTGAVQVRRSLFPGQQGVLPTSFSSAIIFNDVGFYFCKTPDSEVYVGDFDGDSLQDLLCLCKHTYCEGARRHLARGSPSASFEIPMNDPNFDDFCSGTNDKVHVGDFDKDGRDDLLCEKPNGEYQIALTDGDGMLVNKDWSESEGWCGATEDRFYLGYFNNDGRADLMCHTANKTICLRYNSHVYKWKDMFEQQYCTPRTWCETGTIKVADYNGDGYEDIFCFEEDGDFSVSLTKRPTSLVRFVDYDYPVQITYDPTLLNDPSLIDTTMLQELARYKDPVQFCLFGDVYAGEVNGDNRQDILCHDKKDGRISVLNGDHNGYPRQDGSFEYRLRFCYRNNFYPEESTFLVMDMNGDGLSDLVCHFPEDGTVNFVIAQKNVPMYEVYQPINNNKERFNGLFTETFCKGRGLVVYSGDLDGDSKVDLICQGSNLEFLLSEGLYFHYETHSNRYVKCDGLDEQLFVGNFNADNLQDFICFNRMSGTGEVYFSLSSFGSFYNYYIDDPFCGEIGKTGANVHVGDYNGDGLWDIACHYATGKVTLRYNHGVHDETAYFGDEWTWNAPNVPFCTEAGRTVLSYDANGDGLWDLTCHYHHSGDISIAEGHPISGHITAGSVPTSGGLGVTMSGALPGEMFSGDDNNQGGSGEVPG